MSRLLQRPAYGQRDEVTLLSEMNELTERHLAGCPEYARIWQNFRVARTNVELPYLHVGLFKRMSLRTSGVEHTRSLLSSSTGGTSSRISLDEASSQMQSSSSLAILESFCGTGKRPLLVVDSARSLVRRGEVAARVAAALSLRPLSSDVHFLLADPEDPRSGRADLAKLVGSASEVLIYGFTSMLWSWFGGLSKMQRSSLGRVCFVHSGGWKRLEAQRVGRREFETQLLQDVSPGSRVIDYYGLVEQVGVIYPLCEFGSRHVPVWADVVVRDPHSLLPTEVTGQLQLMNPLALGAPYHSVLTEDLGRLLKGACPCGRSGPRFELISRMPRAEVRGCANV